MNNRIQVSVQPAYLPEQSQPEAQRFVYRYTITIANTGEQAAQLLSRHWIIKDEMGRQQEVMGEGVVGEQPHLVPGQSYTYSSGVVLETETGIMHGSYQMRADDGTLFDADIPAFALVPPYAMH